MKEIDKNFFKFVGIDVDHFEQEIAHIKKVCDVTELSKYSEVEIQSKYFKHLENNCLGSVPSSPILLDIFKILKSYVKNPDFYEKDVHTALYMLIGSLYAEFNSFPSESHDIKLFSIIYNNSVPYSLGKCSAWCKALQTLLKKDARLSLLSDIDSKTRVEKYAYLKIRDVYKELYEIIDDMKKHSQEECNAKQSRRIYMSLDGQENIILLDWLLGTSLAEICFVHTSKWITVNTSCDERVIKCLANIKCCNIRNKIADILLQIDSLEIISENQYTQFIDMLNNFVKVINTMYSISLYLVWNEVKKCVKDNIKEVWDEIIMRNAYGVSVPVYDNYHQTIYQDICHEKGIIEIPNLQKNKSNVLQNMGGIELLEEIQKQINYPRWARDGRYFNSSLKNPINSVEHNTLYSYKEAEKINNKRMKEDEKRGILKNPKSLNEWYIKIQSIITGCQIAGNFPVFNE